MSYFDDASLVFIPSGTKTSKAYSVKPIDGTGDLTFTRSNDTATRVNSAGLIEKVRTNLAQRSDDFDNAYWIKSASSVTANATTNPLDGATNADKLVESATTASHFIYNSSLTPAAVNHTYSVYAKAAERTSIQLVSFNGSTDAVGLFNLSTGVVTTQTNGIARIESVGGGWYRCSITHTNAYVASASDYWGQIFLVDGSGNTNYAGNGTSGLFIFGAQFEVSDFGATSYIATTSAAVSVGPVANVPRLDYLNSSCPRLLLEPQRQNTLNFSESFDNAYWNKAGTTITANNTTSPDGYTNADRLTSNGAGNDEYVQRSGLSTTAGTYTSSIFVKNVNATQTVLMAVHLGEGSITSDLRYTWSTGAVTISGTNAVSGKATSYGNGWVRLEFTYTIGASVTGHWFRTYVQTGVSTNSIFIYGASVELGAYATSYIPTLGAAVTRGADLAEKTSISSLVGGSEGTFFLELDYKPISSTTSALIYVGSLSNIIGFASSGTNTLRVRINAVNDIINSVNPSIRHKIAISFNASGVVCYVNGSSIALPNGASQVVSGLDTIGLNPSTRYNDLDVYQMLYFKTRLTNAQLAELTSL